MSYVVLARKWRPMDFSDLIGQDHVARTLANAIAHDRVAHAFLFTGVRGVGKTTSARILAKALNCMANDGPTATPCLKCSACNDIASGSDMDVQEIDGASYNGVDEVRRLQESLPYRPSRDRYKIIIVDEVHMLSQSAWNALLKTLEEPPAHVKFIFATTEVHKVPITILSRVQRFDFKLIASNRIIERLRHVLAHEHIEADDEALSIIARQAAGSMRDAMSLLDQVIAWNASSLTGEGVARVLGVASRQVLYDLTRALLDGQPQPALALVHDLASQGFEMSQVARDLLALLRDVVVAATCDDFRELIDLPEAELADVAALAKHPVDDLLRLHQGFSKGYDEVVRSGQPRAGLEMLLVRLARRPPLIPINDLVERLIRLEKRLAAAGGPSGRSGGGNASRSRPERIKGSGSSPTSGLGATARPTPAQPPAARAPRRELHGAAPPARPSAPERRTPASSSASADANTAPGTPPGTGSQPLDGQQRPRAADPPLPLPISPAGAPASPRVPESRTTESAEPPNGATSRPSWLPLAPLERWRYLVDALRQGDPKLGAFLDHARVHQVDAEIIELSFERPSLFADVFDDPAARRAVLEVARDWFGQAPRLVVRDAPAQTETAEAPTVFEVDRQHRQARQREALDSARQHPVVLEAIRVLGARVKHIELPKD